MSKGHGSTQRRILEVLRSNLADPVVDEQASWTRLADLAADGTHASIESARRAVHRLADEGLVEISGRAGSHLWARITPDAEQQAAIDELRAEREAKREKRVIVASAERKARWEAEKQAKRAKEQAHREAVRVARNARRRAARAIQGKPAVSVGVAFVDQGSNA